MIHRVRRGGVAAVVLAVILTVVAGCGSSGNPSPDSAKGATGSSIREATGQADDARSDSASDIGTRDSSGAGSPAYDDRAHGASGNGTGATRDTDAGHGSASGSGSGAGTGAGSNATLGSQAGGDSSADGVALPSHASPLDVARASVGDVVLLHNVSVGLAHPSGLPGNAYADQAAQLTDAFTAQHDALRGAAAPEAKHLAEALGTYAALAKQVKAAALSKSKTLPKSFVSKLKSTDATWKRAVTAIGDAAQVDLLANLPPLLMPSRPGVTVPPPPE